MSPTEIKHFVDRFGISSLIDTAGRRMSRTDFNISNSRNRNGSPRSIATPNCFGCRWFAQRSVSALGMTSRRGKKCWSR